MMMLIKKKKLDKLKATILDLLSFYVRNSIRFEKKTITLKGNFFVRIFLIYIKNIRNKINFIKEIF